MVQPDFSYYLQACLYLLMGFIGIGISIKLRKKHAQLSLWTGIYFAVKAGLIIVSMVVNSIVQNAISRDAFSSIVTLLTLERYFTTGVSISASLILLFIIFGWRDEKEPLMIFKI